MTAEEFATAIQGAVEKRDVSVRQVSNGFVISANRRFVDGDTETNKFGLSVEGVAMDTNLLLMTLERFFRTGELAAEN